MRIAKMRNCPILQYPQTDTKALALLMVQPGILCRICQHDGVAITQGQQVVQQMHGRRHKWQVDQMAASRIDGGQLRHTPSQLTITEPPLLRVSPGGLAVTLNQMGQQIRPVQITIPPSTPITCPVT